MEKQTSTINNQFYEDLGEHWFTRFDHPVALLRAENNVRIPWILDEIDTYFKKKISLLDLGCGAGFLTHATAIAGHSATGIDLSSTSLEIARQHDTTRSARYLLANAYSLPFKDASFDVVSAMDILEHLEDPGLLIAEASRVLKPGGLFFFHTFNRNLLSYLLVIKGVEWFIRNTPKNMHVYPLFIKPSELEDLCRIYHLTVQKWIGLKPKILPSLFPILFTRKVPPNFTFSFCKSLATGYCGFAKKS